ncbi:hypothetical protein AGRO_5506 [Agrobacterium sp. ATCC 31749]|nr:hypothetical protein AGRO_5506 [Agrobacterium sp. ATCC 31749]
MVMFLFGQSFNLSGGYSRVSLIPVLVTGIQPAQVLGLRGVFASRRRASAGFL